MRIRKRKVPLPFSLLSPIPLSDPHLFSRSPVILLQDETTVITTGNNNNNSQPSDHLTYSDLHRLIDDGSSSSDHRNHHDRDRVVKSDPLVKQQQQQEAQLVGCLGNGGVESVPKGNNDDDASNKSITALGAAVAAADGPSLLPSSNHAERARWCNEEKAMPLKKRRGISLERTDNDDNNNKAYLVQNKQARVEINFKVGENHVEKAGFEDEERLDTKDDNNVVGNGNNSSNKGVSVKKGSKRGNTIMEGSRCSRVNGRGWRCCQPTLVGYSLCEHHLGKGRLRSMTAASSSNSVIRGRSSLKKSALGMTNDTTTTSTPLMQLCEAAKKESEAIESTIIREKKAAVGKRVKLGVVKARSLSSLLGQTNDHTTSSGSASMKMLVATLDYDNNERNVDL